MPAKKPTKTSGFVVPLDPEYIAKVAKMKPEKEHYTRVVQQHPFPPDHGTPEQIRKAVRSVLRKRKQEEIRTS